MENELNYKSSKDKKIKIISQIIIILMAIFGVCTCCFPYIKITVGSTDNNVSINGFSILTNSNGSLEDISVFIKVFTILYVSLSIIILVRYLIKIYLGKFKFLSGCIVGIIFIIMSILYLVFGVLVKEQYKMILIASNFYTAAFWPLIINIILTTAYVLVNLDTNIIEKQ